MLRTACILISLATAAIALPSASADCQATPIVTVGGTQYPSDGVYTEHDCTPAPSGSAGATVSTDGPSIVQKECRHVPELGVYGQKVPGTDQDYCTVPVGGSWSYDQRGPAYGDDGIIVCANAVGGSCTFTSLYYLNYECWSLDTGDVPLAAGETVRVACTLA